jgi:hypothetical protein
LDEVDGVYGARCAQPSNLAEGHRNKYGNCYVQEQEVDNLIVNECYGEDYTCEKDGYFVAGFREEEFCHGETNRLILKCCTPYI